MSAVASTGSPTLRRPVTSRNVSQENSGSSEDMAGRLVSFTLERAFAFTTPIPHIIWDSKVSRQPLPPHFTFLHSRFSTPLPRILILVSYFNTSKCKKIALYKCLLLTAT